MIETLTINGDQYTAQEGEVASKEIRRAFKLTSATSGRSYYIKESTLGIVCCSCEDYIFRRLGTSEACKHTSAMLAVRKVEMRRD